MPTTAYAVQVVPPSTKGFYDPIEVRFEHAAAPGAEPNPNPAYLVRDGSTPLQGRHRISDVTTFYFPAVTPVNVVIWSGGDDTDRQSGVVPAAYATPAIVTASPSSSGVPSTDLSSRYVTFVNDRPADAKYGLGCAADGTTDDTTLLQAALTAGKPVVLTPGTYLVSNLTYKSGSSLQGLGHQQSIIKQKANSTGALLASANTYDANVVLRGFTLDGNKANQSASNIGLDVNNTSDNTAHLAQSVFGVQDPRNLVSDLLIINTKGSGLRQQGKGAHMFDRIWTMNTDGHGFEILGFDNQWNLIDSGAAGLCGVYMGTSAANNRLTNVKSWFSGQIDRATYGQGMFLAGSFRNQISAVEIQNPGSTGLQMVGSSFNTFGQVAIEFPNTPTNSADGLYIEDGSHNMVLGANISDRGSSPYALNRGLVLAKGAGAAPNATVVIGSVSNAQGGIFALTGGATLAQNVVMLNGQFMFARTLDLGYVPSYANDAAAASAGHTVGLMYFNTTTASFTKRLV